MYENKEEKTVTRTTHRRNSLFWPLLLVAVGVFLLLNTTNIIQDSPWDTLFRLWPLLFIVSGLDSLYKNEGFVAPIILIGIGAVILLSNLGYLIIGSWLQLLRFWPVFLIAFGLDLIIGHRRSTISAVIGLLLGIGILAALVWFAVITPEGLTASLRQEQISQRLDDISQTEVYVQLPAGNLVLEGGAKSGFLMEGDLQLQKREAIEKSFDIVGKKGKLRIEGSGVNYITPTTSPDWDIKLNSTIPTDLTTKVIAGEQKINLSNTEIDSLYSETILGGLTLILPDQDLEDSEVKVTIGKLVIQVPENTGLRINLDSGITNISLPEGYIREDDIIVSDNYENADTQIDLVVEQPIGRMIIENIVP